MSGFYAKVLVLGLALFAAAPRAQAQANFQPGYVVPLAGDTLRGEVDLRSPQRMTNFCVFRPAAGAAPTEYAPTALRAYGLRQGARYEAQPVPAPVVLQNTPAVATAPTPILFMQVLARGKATLYAFPDAQDRNRYCFRTAGQPLVELTQIKEVAVVQGRRMLVEQYPFRDVLKGAMVDCAGVLPLISRAALKDADLVKIFSTYNSCSPGAAPAEGTVRKAEVHWTLLAGVQRGSTTYYDGSEGQALTSDLRPLLGVGVLVNPMAFNRKIALRAELIFQEQRYETTYQRRNSNTTLPINRKLQANLKNLRLPLMLRYTWPSGKLRPYVQAGVELGILLGQDSYLYSLEEQYTGPPTNRSAEVEMLPLSIGGTAGLGLLVPLGTRNALQVEIRFNQLTRASKAQNTLNGPNTLSLLLGYSLVR